MRCYDWNQFVGLRITGFVISDDSEMITFFLADGRTFSGYTEAECCSHTWIESVDNPSALFGVIQSFEEIEMPTPLVDTSDFQEELDYVKYYGIKIVTDHGHCVIDYRNNSNGCYGGYMKFNHPE